MHSASRPAQRMVVLAALLACVLAPGCSGDGEQSGSDKGKEKAERSAAKEPVNQESSAPATVSAAVSGAASGGANSPSPAPLASPPADLEAIRANIGGHTPEPFPVRSDTPQLVRPVSPEITLSHMLDRVWGVRLPGSTAGHALEARIGSPPYTIALEAGDDTDLPEHFPRELVIIVSKKEMIVNDVKVADVYKRAGADGEPETWEIPKGEGAFRIRALTAQLGQYRGFRSTLLRAAGVPPELADGCDLATLVIDEELPYRILAEVILSAGHADIFRFRLATRSPDGLVSYQILSAPRLDQRLIEATHLVGDAWWRSASSPTRDFGFAYVNYIANAVADDWKGECGQDLGVCVPPTVDSEKDLRNQVVRGDLAGGLDAIRRGARLTACREPASATSDPSRDQARRAQEATVAVAGDARQARVSADHDPSREPATVDSSSPATVEPTRIPAGTLLVQLERSGSRVPFVYLREDGAYLVLFDMDQVEAVRSEFFGAEKLGLMVETLEKLHPEPGVLHLGADLEVPVSRLVEVADLLRHRCRIQSMSGRCIERERWLASVYLFASPPGYFELMPEPVPGAEVIPFHPSQDEGAPGPEGGFCPLREVQEAAAPRLDALRACLVPNKLAGDLTLSLRWHAAGRLEVLATDPPLPDEQIRCMKAAFAAPAAAREVRCDAALLLKTAPAPQ